jgi:protein-ribulosamine 3-kinase
MLTPTNIRLVEGSVSSALGAPFNISSYRPAGGGCINYAYVLNTNRGKYFIKLNDASRYPGMFEKEFLGLNLLINSGTIKLPGPCCYGEAGSFSYILMEYIDSSPPGPDFWKNFGGSLAALHRHSADYYGLDHDNYMGSLPQCNRKHPEWIPFFVEERLEAQLIVARNSDWIDEASAQKFSALFGKIASLLPAEPSSLLHGDLWSGNYMVSSAGLPCLIDPAVYYGNREVDIAMTKLFGGFSDDFYRSYDEAFPLTAGWRERTDLYNLYPLLIHLNLFGGSYWHDIKRILDYYT